MDIRRIRKGFTLIELLVVIAIIAILAAILFPIFTAVRNKGQAASCLSNMRQMGIAHIMYMDDDDGILVPIGIIGAGFKGTIFPSSGAIYWPDLLSSYTKKSAKLHKCPTVKNFGIGMNHMQLGKWIAENTPRSGLCGISDIKYPGKTVCFADTGLIVNFKETDPDKWYEDIRSTALFCWFRTPDNVGYYDVAGSADRIVNRHNGQANCTFVDGHVQSMKVSKVGFQYPVRDPLAMWDIY